MVATTSEETRLWDKAGFEPMKGGRILVFGRTGQVARELQYLRQVVSLDRAQANLEEPKECFEAVSRLEPDIVINAAAYTNVDGAEADEKTAITVNGLAPAAMAEAAFALGIPMIQISTDYVFDGSGNRPWKPTDVPNPICVYGRSKFMGETGIRESGCDHLILRTSWVFSPYGRNFVKTMRTVSENKNKLEVVSDQVGGPTSAADIARACLAIADRFLAGTGISGTYHFTGAPDISWADFARRIFDILNREVLVTDIPSSAYRTAAERPVNSRLECSSLEQDYNIKRPAWEIGLIDTIRRLRLEKHE